MSAHCCCDTWTDVLWWWWCGPVCNDACLSMTTHEMHLLWWPCTCVQGPKKSTTQLIKPRHQDLVDELQLRINHSVPDTPNRHVNNLVQVLPRTPRQSLTGTSTTSRCTPMGMQQPVQTTKNCNCGSSAVSSTTALELDGPSQPGRRSSYQCTANRRISMVIRTKGNLHLRHDKDDDERKLWDLDWLHTDRNEESARPANRDIDHLMKTPLGKLCGPTRTVGICLCAMKEMSTTMSARISPRNCPSGLYRLGCRASWAWRRQK